MMNFAIKKGRLLLSLITLFMLGASYYFQYVVGLQPCPLCLMQRICLFILAALTLLNLIANKKQLLTILQLMVSCFGLYFSLRQVWLQSLPEGLAPSCMPSLDVLIQYFSWQTVAQALFWGSGDCAEVTWHFLGISMPGWGSVYFLLMALASVMLLFYKTPGKP